MKIMFMGTPEFARETFRALVEAGFEVAAAVTQPDKPVGRGMKLTPPPVKVYAESLGIPVYQPTTLKDGAFADVLADVDPDVIFVAAYGKILPKYLLDYPTYGCINAHASILPKYRGAAPIQRAVMDGETETGVTAMYMEEGLDTGDAILCEKVEILETDTYGDVHDKLCAAGGAALVKVAKMLDAGEALPREKQDDTKATYAAKITSEDALLDLTLDARVLARRILALSPAPLCKLCGADGKGIKLVRAVSAEAADVPEGAVPGQVIALDTKGDGYVGILCGSGMLKVTSLRPEGKGDMRAADFIRGRKVSLGDVYK